MAATNKCLAQSNKSRTEQKSYEAGHANESVRLCHGSSE